MKSDQTTIFGSRDVVPAWQPHWHEAEEESVLYSFCDPGVQEKLGLLRERRGQEAA